jgi:hypothetical protein
MPQRLKYNFLLKRKLYMGINIKVVEQITCFLISGQRVFNSIPTWSYILNKKKYHYFQKFAFLYFPSTFLNFILAASCSAHIFTLETVRLTVCLGGIGYQEGEGTVPPSPLILGPSAFIVIHPSIMRVHVPSPFQFIHYINF